MNHKNAMPENGTIFNASLTIFQLPESHCPVSSGLAGTDMRMITRLMMSKTEKQDARQSRGARRG
jgi:hypothetical protein